MRQIPLYACFRLFCQLIAECARVFVTYKDVILVYIHLGKVGKAHFVLKPTIQPPGEEGLVDQPRLFCFLQHREGRLEGNSYVIPKFLPSYTRTSWKLEQDSRVPLCSLPPPTSVTLQLSWYLVLKENRLKMGLKGKGLWVRRPSTPCLLQLSS